ncbi:MAG TPA: AAA family ATPase [Acidimicrobiia bacterium]|nr:AAA family ATPase [Acidimicrobiia bacterium]
MAEVTPLSSHLSDERDRSNETLRSAVASTLGQAGVIGRGQADVARLRERNRQRRMQRSLAFFGPLAGYLWWRELTGDPVQLRGPNLPAGVEMWLPQIVLVGLFAVVLLVPLLTAGRSPHVRFRPSEIEIGFDDVRGMDVVLEEVVRTLNLFLGFKTFREAMGGTPRRGVLFEGPPGTGKTYMAKALAKEAGVPFFYVSSSAFQSMYYGQTNRKIRAYFKELRTAARKEGGAVGFIEEIDAIAASRAGMRMTGLNDGGAGVAPATTVSRSQAKEGIAGIVNELLIQMQSFDHPTRIEKLHGFVVDRLNNWLPDNKQLAKRRSTPANVLIIGATNRADDLDPALLRPGRFDRSIHFDLPNRSGRREIIDYYLDRKAHAPELDRADRREALAAMTSGYSPVMIEHLFDEGLVWALREGRAAMTWADVQQAKFTEEIGLKQPVEYTEGEKRRIATHEGGHAVVAHLVSDRNLEVLSIVKRRGALGLLAHSDAEERFTRTEDELKALMAIAFGGMVAEELAFGSASTGPAGDLAYATQLAAQMVGSYGMGGTLISYDAVESGPMAAGTVAKVLSNEAARKRVEVLLVEAKETARRLLAENRHLVEALVGSLLDRNELVGDEITNVLERAERCAGAAPPAAGRDTPTHPQPALQG